MLSDPAAAAVFPVDFAFAMPTATTAQSASTETATDPRIHPRRDISVLQVEFLIATHRDLWGRAGVLTEAQGVFRKSSRFPLHRGVDFPRSREVPRPRPDATNRGVVVLVERLVVEPDVGRVVERGHPEVGLQVEVLAPRRLVGDE